MSQRHRPSLLVALTWTGIGILFLLRNFGIGPDFWSLAARYWPVLLILLGLAKILEYFLRKDTVAIRVGEVVGILLLLLAGLVISRISMSPMGRFFRDFPIVIGGIPVHPGQWMEESHAYSEEAAYPLDSPVPIRIENSYGMVSLAPGSEGEIRVRLKKTIRGSETRARDIANKIHLEAELEGKPLAHPGTESAGNYFLIRTNRDAMSSRNSIAGTDMEILVPKNAAVQVQNTFGEVRASNLSGELDLSTAHRALEVRDCTGQFTISNRHAETRLTDLAGNIRFTGRGKVSIENIVGDVTVTNAFSPLEIVNVDGTVSVSSNEGSIRITKITKPVVLNSSGKDVRIAGLSDSLKITARHQNIDISDVSSDIVLESRYSTLNLKDIRGNVEIRSDSDRVSADDVEGGFTLRARASSLRLNGIRGALDIRTSLKEVIVNDFDGACSIINEFADINISAHSLGTGDINIKNRNGGIALFLPKESPFMIDAVARNGRVESSYAGLEPFGNERNNGVLRARIGTGGPKIRLETEYSNIHISSAPAHGPNRAFMPETSEDAMDPGYVYAAEGIYRDRDVQGFMAAFP
jgi:hypothetical protein